MVDVERIFTVTPSPPVVIDYLSNFAHAEQWDPGTLSCTRIDDGPLGVGSRWHNVSEFMNRKVELTYELTRLEAHRLTFVGKNKAATSVDDITLEPTADGTSITYHATIRFHGLAKFADPFLKREFNKLADETVESMTSTLNKLAGSTTPPDSPR